MTDKVKTVRLTGSNYDALRKFQGRALLKWSLESAANTAILYGLCNLNEHDRQMRRSLGRRAKTYAQNPNGNPGD